MSSRNRFLMCHPQHFEISYVINPWMEGNVKRTSSELAIKQWQKLYSLITQSAEVELVPPQPGLPDLSFTANAGFILEDKVVLSRFLHPERQREEEYFEAWFAAHDFRFHRLPPQIPFEGAGDALLDREQPWIWAGYGYRSVLESHVYLSMWLEMEVLSLRLVDSRFYQLDTCFCPLESGFVMYYPQAFDEPSRRLIAERVPEEKRIVLSEKDAINFACNAVNIGRLLILNRATPELRDQLEYAGFETAQCELSEFLKAGGAAKSLALRLNEARHATAHPTAQPVLEFPQRIIELEGYLLDSSLMSCVINRIVEGGGSFEMLEFIAGARQQNRSRAKLLVTAPSQERLDRILSSLLDLGARLPLKESVNAALVAVQQTGVAPDDFYVTSIYPTEIRFKGEWHCVQHQRMDAAIVVDYKDGKVTARCRLIRDLQSGQKVVCGVEGIRARLKREGRETSESAPLVGGASGIASEHHLELAVEQIAWEMRRLREQGGKVAVVAGPVVVHTGGGRHLARLIRDGYVQALLGGNALAAHDLEQALYGTSPGGDLQRGASGRGGHDHHLKAINKIRACGGIAPAVNQGLISSGIFYECVHHNVPFALAGSIRDDGPLPETQMDLLKAQEQYHKLLQKTQMILMLSSVMHALSVSHMTPAGVKLICVDINPVTVNKLAGRGPAESFGLITDVGLFLSLLARQLEQ